MTISKIYRIKKSRKAQGKCTKCGDELPVGSAYLFWEPHYMSAYKVVRCTKSECAPRNSELETSKISAIYAAIEDVEDQLPGCETPEDFSSLIQGVQEAFTEVIEEYREAMYGADGVTVFNVAAEERAQELEDTSRELDGWEVSDNGSETFCDNHDQFTEGCDECAFVFSEWLEASRGEVMDLLSGLSF